MDVVISEMNLYYFPALFIIPEFEPDEISSFRFKVIKRKWGTTIFDLATLANRHNLHLPYQLMDIFLQRCNVEFCIGEQGSFKEACNLLNAFKIGLYEQGISPFLSPFATTYSVNQYSGINSRDSKLLREELPDTLKCGITSDDSTVEAWPHELSFQCILRPNNLSITADAVAKAGENAERWDGLTKGNHALKALENAAIAAPQLNAMDQSILHIWSALEALFPRISQEVSFRIAIYLAQLTAQKEERMKRYNEVRELYKIRSGIAHGATRKVGFNDWEKTWCLLMRAVAAIMNRGGMPSEDELVSELLS